MGGTKFSNIGKQSMDVNKKFIQQRIDSSAGQRLKKGHTELGVIHEGKISNRSQRVQSAMANAKNKLAGRSQTNFNVKSDSESSSYAYKQAPAMLNNTGHYSAMSNSNLNNVPNVNANTTQQFLPSGQKIGAGPGNIATIDHITPELAAKIVKNYILPMFENSGKRALKSKYNKLQGVATAKSKYKIQPSNETQTVYGELKLSEKLSSELEEVRS